MNNIPFLLHVCLEGSFGKVIDYKEGSICEAGFIYLCGEGNQEKCLSLREHYSNRMLICRSDSWDKLLKDTYSDLCPVTRWQMSYRIKETTAALLEGLLAIPDGYTMELFGEAAFREKPFYHGSNYPNYETFARTGSGACIRYQGEIVASASSFLSYDNQVELDVSTKPEHRHHGLATACAARMLLDCMERGILPHWDAQNMTSRRIAEKLGFELNYAYTAYTFGKRDLGD